MSLLGKIANKEVFDFLRTVTIKSTYFADKFRSTLIKSSLEPFTPETCNPYTIHLAGEYVLQKPLMIEVKNPAGLSEIQTYSASQTIYDRDGLLERTISNADLYMADAFDEMMYVTSLDTGERIPFTLENFYSDYAIAAGRTEESVHSKTLAAYKLPSRYFDLLCQKYPKQVDLIKAIVYRVPDCEISSLVTRADIKEIMRSRSWSTDRTLDEIDRRYPTYSSLSRGMSKQYSGLRDLGVIGSSENLSERRRTYVAKANNFDLLNYDAATFDDNEQMNLVMHVKSVLEMIKKRWDVKEYTYEENYAGVLWSMMWSVLPLSIIAKRYANVKTPEASLNHVWDYLMSKGLASYRGYLTTEQTLFLYKNIVYILEHRGQQHVMNILIDELLEDVGYTIKSKTVLLDTTDSLSKDTKPKNPEVQCATCSRRGITCFKNTKDYLCDEWLGTKHLCKAEPVVLTENFSGASHTKIIKALIKNYGFTEEEAEIRYTRSFIWKDENIEKIRDDLNRDQLVDQSGTIETLETVIDNEHDDGKEPIVNDDVIDEQRASLQLMHGTYAPTKLLELNEKQYNVKFTELFNRFITETFIRFAPYKLGNRTIHRVKATYKFSSTETSSEFLFNFGEMMSMAYLGFVREYNIDAMNGKVYGQWDEHGKFIPEKITTGGITHDKWDISRVTDLSNTLHYKWAIPNKLQLTTAFKYGKPVLQSELINAWYSDDGSYSGLVELVTNRSEDPEFAKTKVIQIGSKLYAVEITNNPEDPTIWDSFGVTLQILGYFTTYKSATGYNYVYIENDEEIPLIPVFVRWYCQHLNPDDHRGFSVTKDKTPQAGVTYYYIDDDNVVHEFTGTTFEPTVTYYVRVDPSSAKVAKKYVDGHYVYAEVNAVASDDLDQCFDSPAGKTDDPKTQSETVYFDESKKAFFKLVPTAPYLDLDTILGRWIDATKTFNTQEDLAEYIDVMFDLLESIYIYPTACCSIRTHLVCTKFLDCVLSKKHISFDLTGTVCRRDCTDGSLCAYYSDWFNANTDVATAVTTMDRASDPERVWNSFNSDIIKQLLKGCTIEYARNTTNKTQYEKLKELVTKLSSYRVAMIDVADQSRICNDTAAISEDALTDTIVTTDVIYFDPIGDSVDHPRVGGFMTPQNPIESSTPGFKFIDGRTASMSGDMFVPTHDTYRVSGKTYYSITTDGEPTFVEYTATDVGMSLPYGKCYEKINLMDILGIPRDSVIKIFKKDYRWFYSIRSIQKGLDGKDIYINSESAGNLSTGHQTFVTEPEKLEIRDDEFLDNSYAKSVDKKFFNSKVYRRVVQVPKYIWSEAVQSDKLEYWLEPMCAGINVKTENTEWCFDLTETSSTESN